MFIEHMRGQDYILASREYLDYLERHLENVRIAFENVSNFCDGMSWVGDDNTWHTIRVQVMNHDLSKFSKEEFTQYRDSFYGVPGDIEDETEFDKAWEHHKKSNHHHWETVENEIDVIHMIIVWTAMSYEFGDSAQKYYESHKDEIKIDDRWIPFMYDIFERLKGVQRDGAIVDE